jgi:hypothetical protein
MSRPTSRKIARWTIDHLLWETAAPAGEDFRGWLWATWKLSAAVAGAAVLTWWEWVKHHPPEIAVIAVIHFIFVLIAIALVVHLGRWFSRSGQKSGPKRRIKL